MEGALASEAVRFDAGVDYLRLTHRAGSHARVAVNQYIRACLEAGQSGGSGEEREEPAALLGYKGWRVGSCFWGQSEQGLMLQASAMAARAASMLHIPNDNVPRFDIQATLWYASDEADKASELCQTALAYRSGAKGRSAKPRLISTFGEGDTLYIGKRHDKTRMLRVYDKFRESKGEEVYRNAWRFEIELANEYAVMAYGAWQDTDRGMYAAASMVEGYLRRWGLTLGAILEVLPIAPEALPKDEGSDERRLRWLREQVAPAIQKMMLRGISAEEIVEALGI